MSDGVLGGDRQRTVGDSTRFDTEELPEEVYHKDIWYYRDMGGEFHSSYQLGFRQSWLPFDYYLPDRYEIIHARVEYQYPPEWGWLRRKVFSKRKALCVVIGEAHEIRKRRMREKWFGRDR